MLLNFVVPWTLASPCRAYDVCIPSLMRTEAARQNSSSNYSSILVKFLLPLWARFSHAHFRVAEAGLRQSACMRYTKQRSPDTIWVTQPYAQDDHHDIDAHLSAAAVEIIYHIICQHGHRQWHCQSSSVPAKSSPGFNTANSCTRHHPIHIHKGTVMQCSSELHQ